jgi:hypothetical protein
LRHEMRMRNAAAGASTYAVDSACAVVVEVASELSRH